MRSRTAMRAAVLSVSGVMVLTGCSVAASDLEPSRASGASGSSGATSSAIDPRLESFYAQELRWSACGGDFECASLRVPLAYDDPTGKTIELKVIRLPAAGRDRIGSLVLNPGGPGGSGIDYARAARGVTSDALRERFDIVGFDPRGVASSEPIDCLDDKQTDAYIAADASPDTPAEIEQLAELSAEVGAACAAKSPDLVANIGTVDAARDLDILRAALRDPALNYLGKSYGTFLGSTYAEQFPRTVGRMVLDGAIDPALDSTALAEGQAAGFELALRRFVENCQSYGCTLDPDPDTALRQVRQFLQQVDAQPLPTDQSGRSLNEALAVLGIVGSLYDRESGWATLSEALSSAFRGDGSALLAIGDYYTDRRTDGTYATNANDAIYAVNCWDKPATPGVSETQALAADWAVKYPTFGEYLAWGNLPCATWPGHSSIAPHPAVAPGTPEILVVGTVNDPATPVAWARSLASQLSRGVYLEWTGDGHTAYSRGSDCIDRVVDDYFLEGAVPASGTVCN